MTDISEVVHDTLQPAEDHARAGWRKPKHGRGMLKPFQPGNRLGGNKATRYIETQQLARAHSLEAVQALVERLHDPDGRIVVVAANSLLERAWGKSREIKPEEERQAHIDLSRLSTEELAIMVRLVESGRLRSSDDQPPPPTIDGEATDH